MPSTVTLKSGGARTLAMRPESGTWVDLTGEGLGPVSFGRVQSRRRQVESGRIGSVTDGIYQPTIGFGLLCTRTVLDLFQLMARHGRRMEIRLRPDGDGTGNQNLQILGVVRLTLSISQRGLMYQVQFIPDGDFTETTQ